MMVDIEKIIVKDRIRKDLGDIQELADDIKANGLINPPVVNKEYHLLAGERRLTACKSLGWKQIEVRMMDTKDEEHDFEIEVSENESRKDFSRVEREEIYTRRVKRRLESGSPIGLNSNEVERQVAKYLGTSRTNMQREQQIVDNKDLLTPEDFADWDEGRLSTNKAFQKIKAKQQEAEEENERLRRIITSKDAENVKLKQQKQKEVEVYPDDYEDLKRDSEASKKECANLRKEYDRMAEKWKEAESKNDALLKTMNAPEEKRKTDLKNECFFFCTGVKNFLEKYGGYVYLKNELDLLPEREQKAYMDSIKEVRAWVDTMLDEITIGGQR